MLKLNQGIDYAVLTPVVRRMLGNDALTLGAWNIHPIAYPNVHSQSRGLFRIAGSAHDGGMERAWSLVLKVFTAPSTTADDATASVEWQREALAYQSALLPHAAGGMTTPRCFGVEHLTPDTLFLWLEDVAASDDARWSLARYGLAGRHWGAFGGARMGDALPAEPWLIRNYTSTWIASFAPLIELAQQQTAHIDPLLQRTVPPAVIKSVVRLWNEHDTLVHRLAHLPQTVCHHDVWRNNLISRHNADGQDETIVLDWEMVGLGAAGEDVGNLLGVSLLNFDVEATQADVLADTLLAQYVEGLHDAGWRGDPQAIAYAFTMAAALRCVWATACWPLAIMRDPDQHVPATEQRWGRSIEQVFEHWAATTQFLLDRAEAARNMFEARNRV